MDKKKEIGQRIWELFSKNYSYSDIARELGINKSVVSNVINYCTPNEMTYDKSIKQLKENCEKEKKVLEEELYYYYKNIVKKIILYASFISAALFSFVISFTYLPNKILGILKLKNTFLTNIIALLAIGAVFFVVVYIILLWVSRDEI